MTLNEEAPTVTAFRVRAVTALVVTFRRPDSLLDVLEALRAQTRPPDRILVIDNDADPGTETIVDTLAGPGWRLEYVPVPGNLGPAGGIAAGLDRLARSASDPDGDWVLLVDDDDPPESPTVVADLLEVLERADDPRIAAVGVVGARLDRRTGLLVRLRDDELHGLVEVDYIGSGMFPLYRLRAVLDAGGFDHRLFFGEEELDLGLRLRTSGHRLVVDGDALLARRGRQGRLGLRLRPGTAPPHASTWRRYYGVRNHVYLLRRHAGAAPAVRYAALVLAKSSHTALMSKDATDLKSTVRALLDAARGRLGKTVDPLDHGGNPAKSR